MPDVRLVVGGKGWGGWKSVRIRRSIEQVAGTFSVSVSERWPGQPDRRRLRPGMACRVEVDGDVLITGFIDDVRIGWESERHDVEISGRDRTADLVDCSAVSPPSQWLGQSLADIARDLCRPFGVKVAVGADLGEPIPSFVLQPGEAAFDALERAARMRAALLVSDGRGGLLLTRAGGPKAQTALVEGENLLSLDAVFSHRDRHSVYWVKGEAPGLEWGDAEDATARQGQAEDWGISRFRPLTLLAEQQGNIALYQKRAEWERNVRLGRGLRVTAAVQGWRQAGQLWRPNTRVRLRAPVLSLDLDLLIAAVTFSLDTSGTRAALELTRPEAFDPEPYALPEDMAW